MTTWGSRSAGCVLSQRPIASAWRTPSPVSSTSASRPVSPDSSRPSASARGNATLEVLCPCRISTSSATTLIDQTLAARPHLPAILELWLPLSGFCPVLFQSQVQDRRRSSEEGDGEGGDQD